MQYHTVKELIIMCILFRGSANVHYHFVRGSGEMLILYGMGIVVFLL